MTFETALSGLNAAAADLDVTGHNLANANTMGFKSSRAEFADIFASSNLGVSQNAIGQGVRLSNVAQQFTQGQFNFTGNSLDLAINGRGFYRLNSDGETQYTRAGAFNLDREGYISDSQGRRLTGFTADTAGNISGALGDLQVQTGNIAPSATTEIGMEANLDANESPPPLAPFDLNDPDTYNFSTSTTVYDSLGRPNLFTFYFVQTGTAGEWDVYTQLAGDPNGPSGPNTATFGPDGSIVDVDGGAPSVTYNISAAAVGSPIAGANDLAMTVDYSSLTQFGTPFGVTSLNQDGFAAGEFSSLSVEDDGIVFARFTNGQSRVLGQVALAQFSAPQDLQQIGDTSWVETFGSGAPLVGTPGSGGLGALQSGAVEQSNVNLTEQLVKMITAQRNYSANAQMISTQDEITQEILNI